MLKDAFDSALIASFSRERICDIRPDSLIAPNTDVGEFKKLM